MQKDVYSIAFSAFFADLGYQAVLAALPLYLVVILHAPIYLYGIAEGLNYGVGSIFSTLGGKLSDKYSSKKVALLGNSLIPLLSLTALTFNPILAVILFATGWWFRNFRTPARRKMLASVTSAKERSEAYGILHALDLGGGALAVTYLVLSLYLGISLRLVLLFTVIPLIVSTLVLLIPKVRQVEKGESPIGKSIVKRVLVAAALFGFSYYSFGFPILSVYSSSGKLYLAAATYAFFLFSSALTGYVIGKVKRNPTRMLGLGYVVAAIGSLGFEVLRSLPLLYISALIIGIGAGFVETFEPTIISLYSEKTGTGLGYLSSARSIGLFFGNVIMGILFTIDLAYWYAFAVSLIASLVVFSIS
ncbi:MFS transporter [Sulfolobales archaeon HS-7]|nr:MFS transporter [Sulfolobales archaeon HS-7]